MIYKRGKCKLDGEGRCPRCGKKGSCGVYWYKFMWKGKLIRESTKQGNDKVARQMERRAPDVACKRRGGDPRTEDRTYSRRILY
jgi:hypothetical protein